MHGEHIPCPIFQTQIVFTPSFSQLSSFHSKKSLKIKIFTCTLRFGHIWTRIISEKQLGILRTSVHMGHGFFAQPITTIIGECKWCTSVHTKIFWINYDGPTKKWSINVQVETFDNLLERTFFRLGIPSKQRVKLRIPLNFIAKVFQGVFFFTEVTWNKKSKKIIKTGSTLHNA